MDFPPSNHLESAIALQTLALPCTLLLCIISMLRERSIDHRDEKRLVRLYKQHAFVLELVQFFVALMACGFVAGNTFAAYEARSLVIDFASEDVTSAIVRYAIARNAWLSGSALCVLVCMNMLDSWSLPRSLQDVTDPLFRLTRELVRSYIWRHDYEDYQIHDYKHFPYDVEQPFSVSSTAASIYTERSSNETLEGNTEKNAEEATTSTESTEEASKEGEKGGKEPNTQFAKLPDTPPQSPPTSPSKTHTNNNHTRSSSLSRKQRSQVSHPPISRPRYQNQTLTSALRASSNAASRSRSRKRSVTFDLSAKSGDGATSTQSSRERSLVRERVEEVERRVRGEDEDVSPEGGEEGKLAREEKGQKSEEVDGAKQEGGQAGDESVFEDAVQVGSNVVVD